MNNIIALIPARSGSKGVPDKNIKPLGGLPLIQWSIEACKKSKIISKVIVSTDSSHYKKVCQDLGAEVPFLRPEEISRDSSSDLEFVKHALDWFQINESEPDYLVHIRPTTPLRDPKIIDAAINKFINQSSYTSLRSVHEMSESAYKNFEITDDETLVTVFERKSDLDLSNSGRQLFPKTYIPNGYVDVLKTSFIRDANLLHGNKVMPFITNQVSEIDTNEDFDFLKYQISVDSFAKEVIFDFE